MASTSSLLKSAAAARKRLRTQQDAVAAFEWESSAQTYDDYIAYSNYLETQSSQTSDPSDQLTYESKIRSARRSYTSNEIQRQQIAIMEGRGDTRSKMDSIKALYDQAVEAGDYNLAQNLYSQWDALSIKAQNEQEAAVKKYQAAGSKASKDLEDSLIYGIGADIDPDTGEAFVKLPNGEIVKPLNQFEDEIKAGIADTTTWEGAAETIEALAAVVIDRYQNPNATQEDVDALEKKYGPGLRNLYDEIHLKAPGVGKLTAQDLINAAADDQFNNPHFGLVRDANGDYKLKRNNVEQIDYVRQVNPETGVEEYVPAQLRTDQSKVMFGSSDQGRGLNTQITNEGSVVGNNNDGTGNINAGQGSVNRDDSLSIENRLKSLGIIARQDGTTLMVKLPGENVERIATIQPDGSIRYMREDQNGDGVDEIVEIGLVDRNLGTDMQPQVYRAGEQRIVSYEELSDFGSQSPFGGTRSQASAQGRRYLDDITGKAQSPIGELSGPIRTGNDFGGFGTAVTSSLLQTAGATRRGIEQEQQRQQMLQQQAQMQLQASQTFNLNQVPIQQLTSNGILKSQLSVAAPRPTPRVVVAAPTPTPRITSVNVAQPTARVSGVAPLPAQPRVRVY